jgi:hypothetical protein
MQNTAGDRRIQDVLAVVVVGSVWCMCGARAPCVCAKKSGEASLETRKGITTGRREETTSMLELLEHELLGLLPRVFGVS